VRDLEQPQHVVIEHDRATTTDRSHRQLRVTGRAQLAHDQDVQRRLQYLCDLERDRHASAR